MHFTAIWRLSKRMPGVKILDLCAGTGNIPRCIANAWMSNKSLRIIGVDKSEAMLEVAMQEWSAVPKEEAEWNEARWRADMDLALISAGSFLQLVTREQLLAIAEVRDCIKAGGVLVLNLFAMDEIVDEVSSGDHNGAEVWHLKDGFWKQTLNKIATRLEDVGVTGTETFKIGCENWTEQVIC